LERAILHGCVYICGGGGGGVQILLISYSYPLTHISFLLHVTGMRS
jgi:hypothetical protein